VHGGGFFVSTHLISASPRADPRATRSISKICFVLEPVRSRASRSGDAVEREHEALAADAVAERLEEFLAAVLVGLAERLDERRARLLVADLAEAVRGLAARPRCPCPARA
jgi:hypothetical protein